MPRGRRLWLLCEGHGGRPAACPACIDTTVIATHPGISFRALGRTTGLPTGSLAHHLRMIKRAGDVVEAQLGHRRTFYPATSRVPNAAEATLAREPALVELQTWIAGQGRACQRAALDAMQGNGWSRSTTQHRLTRMVALGLVVEMRSGRFVLYTATSTSRQGPHAPPRAMLEVPA